MIDIAKVAREAARSENSRLLGCGVDDLERFAHLIREAVVQELVVGSGEPVLEAYVYKAPGGSLRSDFYTADQLAGAVAKAKAEEREMCAKVCDELAERSVYPQHYQACLGVAAAIRGKA